jgi:hypothetical protein
VPLFKIHRLREPEYKRFRWAPHTTGAAQVKPKDYELAGDIECATIYEAWSRLRDSGRPLRIGDLLESEQGELRICKYVGFEEAAWFVPEPKSAPEGEVQGA